MVNSIFITIKKEVRSILRDKKTLITLLIFPLFIPLMIFLYCYMYDDTSEEKNYLIGVNYEVNNIESSLLDEVNLDTKFYNDLSAMEVDYYDGKIFGFIDYDDTNEKYTIYTNKDSSDGMYVNSYINAYLKGYNDYLKELYLIGEDIDIEEAENNFIVEEVNLEGENLLLELIFNIAFTYIIMSIVMSSTNMATSATAVEKENGTLETLLTFPITAKNLIVGKYMATAIIGFISSLIGLVLTIISLIIANNYFDCFKDINFTFGFGTISLSILVVILASLFIAGVSILVTSRTKSFKEAQSISSMLSLVSIIPMMVSLMEISINSFYYFIPILNYTQILMDIFSGVMLFKNILIVIISSILFIVGVIYLVIKRQRSEEVLFQGEI